jgi:hypothetical protein
VRYKETRYSSYFAYTEDRTDANILLTVAATLSLEPTDIRAIGNRAYTINFSNALSTTVDVLHVLAPEVAEEQRIHDMSAGLNELIYRDNDLARRLDAYQISFVIPGFHSDEDAETIWEELQRYLRSRKFAEAPEGDLHPASREYPALQKHRTKIAVRRGESSFIQIVQGAMAIAGPEVGVARLVMELRRALSAAKTHQGARWLLLWFQSISMPLNLRGAETVLDDLDIRPYERLLISDGRTLATIEGAPDAKEGSRR